MNKKVLCPICRKETPWEGNPFRPFCSERCRTRDLGHWAAGNYAVPGEKVNASNEFLLDASQSSEKKHS